MEKLRELVELAELAKESGQRSKEMVEFRDRANPDAILAISEAFRELELAHCGGALLERELHHVEVIKEILKYNSVLEANLATTIPDDWKLVPVQPTKEMVLAWQDKLEECINSGFDSCEDGSTHEYSKISSDAPYLVYLAMLAAAPEVSE